LHCYLGQGREVAVEGHCWRLECGWCLWLSFSLLLECLGFYTACLIQRLAQRRMCLLSLETKLAAILISTIYVFFVRFFGVSLIVLKRFIKNVGFVLFWLVNNCVDGCTFLSISKAILNLSDFHLVRLFLSVA